MASYYLKKALTIRRHAEKQAADLPALMVHAEKAVSSVIHGAHLQRKAGQGERFWQFREYVPGDRPQDIDWRQSAKTDRVFIRQKEWQTAQTTIFWCSHAPGMDFHPNPKYFSKADSARILTLALAILMARADEQVGMFGDLRTGRSEAALERIGNALCDHNQDEENLPVASSNPLPKNCSFIQAGDFLSPFEKIENSFKTFAGHTNSGLVIQILDPAELNLPYEGRMVFEDTATRSRETINHVSSIRSAYQDRLQSHIHDISALCRQCDWHHILHRTDTPLKSTLAKICMHMSFDNKTAGVRI